MQPGNLVGIRDETEVQLRPEPWTVARGRQNTGGRVAR